MTVFNLLEAAARFTIFERNMEFANEGNAVRAAIRVHRIGARA